MNANENSYNTSFGLDKGNLICVNEFNMTHSALVLKYASQCRNINLKSKYDYIRRAFMLCYLAKERVKGKDGWWARPSARPRSVGDGSLADWRAKPLTFT